MRTLILPYLSGADELVMFQLKNTVVIDGNINVITNEF